MGGNILIVDDHEVIRRGLRSLLSGRSDWTICGEAVDGVDAIEKARYLRPDVVLMDISMPRMDGLEATRVIRKELPESKVLIVSQNDPTIVRRQAREVDAAAYVAKSDLAEHLLPTLDRISGNSTNGTPASAPAEKADSLDWLASGGTLGRLIREFDWSRTPLGPIGKWPQSLRISVNIILNSQHPMWIGWGKDITFLYNDAYISVLSLEKHPWALGRPASEVWAEIWDTCGVLSDRVFQKGEASFIDEMRLFMDRGDFLEETYYSFSYSPIRDESGKVAGLFCPSTEVTPKIINARRLRTLSELSSHALAQKTIEAACKSAVATLGDNPDDIPFALLYLIDWESRTARLEGTEGLAVLSDALSPTTVDLSEADSSECMWPIAEVAKSGRSRVMPLKNVKGLPLDAAQQSLSEGMVLPVTSLGTDRPLGLLIAGVSPARRLDVEYRTFYELVAGQIATAIENARVVEKERKRLEALAEIDRAKTAFFSNVSHEFRTPLTLMLGPIEELLAKANSDLPAAARSQLEIVNRNGSRLLRLVNTLLDFSRIEAGRMRAVYQPTDLSAYTAELASVFRSTTERAGLQLELDCPQLSEPVFVDLSMWEKIVLNLISNAFKFTFEGKISVGLRQTDDHVELRVSDTGVGIPKEELPHLFDRFHRVENTRSRTHEGTGIGLALVQELVKLHGGNVQVESVVDHGTTFIVTVPLGSQHLPAGQIGGLRTPASTAIGSSQFVEEALSWLPNLQSEVANQVLAESTSLPISSTVFTHTTAGNGHLPAVMVVDDNADMRDYLSRLLSERYEVIAMPDGEAALSAATARHPDLVLTDVMMPKLDGFGLLRELRSNPQTSTIPIILLSARAGEEARVEGVSAGADDYLIKPFAARELMARVDTHLNLSRVRKEAEALVRQRQEELRRTNERLRTVLDSSAVGIAVLSLDGRFLELNKEFCRITGRSAEEIKDLDCPALGDPDDCGVMQKEITRLVAGEIPSFDLEMRYRRKDGEEIWVQNTVSLTADSDGRPAQLVLICKDVTEGKRLELQLRQSEQHLREMIDALPAAIYTTDAEGRLTHFNPAAVEFSGRVPKIGTDRWCVSWKLFRADGTPLPHDECPMALALKEGKILKGIEVIAERPDGSRRWFMPYPTTLRDPQGKTVGGINMLVDITDQKEGERATQLLAAIVDSSDDAIISKNLDGVITSWNKSAEALFGYTAEEAMGRHVTFIIPRDRWNEEEGILSRLRRGERVDHFETVRMRKDGTTVDLALTISPVRDREGRVIGASKVARDISGRKIAERALRESEERFRAIVETTPECVKLVARDGTLLHMNAPGLQMVGASSAEEVVGKSIYDFIAPKDRDRFRTFNERVCGGERGSLEFDIIGLQGNRLHMETHAAPLRDRDGALVQLGVTSDITERSRSQAALRESEERLRALVKASSYIMYRMTPDWADVIQLDSQGHKADIPTSRDRWLEHYVHTEDRAMVKESIEKAVEAKTLVELEHRVQRKNGSVGWALLRAVPIFDANGNVTEWFGAATDVTPRKEADEREREITAESVAATAKFRAVFEQTTVFAGIMTNDGVLVEANRLYLDACGYRAEDVLGKPFWQTGWWVNFKESQEKIRVATPLVAQGIPYREILHYSWADGTERLVDFALYPIVDQDGKVLFLHPTGVDITDIKRAEANYRSLAESLDAQVRARTGELEKRNADMLRQSDLLRDLSRRLLQAQDQERRHIARELHDSAGQILTALGMSLAPVAEHARKNSPQLAKDADDSERLVQELSREIRTMSYLLHPPLLDETGLSEALRWYIDGLMERSELKIRLTVPEDFGRLSRELELVMFRLVQECLTNIHRHSESDSAEIRIVRDGDNVSLEVQDSGKGISREKLAEIQSKGSGVGIRGMRERVQQFGGRMEIESDRRGTKVSFSFPLQKTSSSRREAIVQSMAG